MCDINVACTKLPGTWSLGEGLPGVHINLLAGNFGEVFEFGEFGVDRQIKHSPIELMVVSIQSTK
jgi:hypothetical protein